MNETIATATVKVNTALAILATLRKMGSCEREIVKIENAITFYFQEGTCQTSAVEDSVCLFFQSEPCRICRD